MRAANQFFDRLKLAFLPEQLGLLLLNQPLLSQGFLTTPVNVLPLLLQLRLLFFEGINEDL